MKKNAKKLLGFHLDWITQLRSGLLWTNPNMQFSLIRQCLSLTPLQHIVEKGNEGKGGKQKENVYRLIHRIVFTYHTSRFIFR